MCILKLLKSIMTIGFSFLMIFILGCSNAEKEPKITFNNKDLKKIDIQIGIEKYVVSVGNKILKQKVDQRIWKKAEIMDDFSVGGIQDTTLFSPSRVKIDKFGNIYVLDIHAKGIKKFSPNGEYIRIFGKSGNGPGEFRLPFRFDVLPDGQLIVYDSQLNKFEIFDDGKSFQILSRGMITSLCFLNKTEFSILNLIDPINKAPIKRYNIRDKEYFDYQKILIGTESNKLDVGILPFLDGTIKSTQDENLFYFPLVMNYFVKFSKDGSILLSRNTMDNFEFTSYNRDEYSKASFRFPKNQITTFASSIYKDKIYLVSMSAIRMKKDKKEYTIDVYSMQDGDYFHSFVFHLLPKEGIVDILVTDSKIYLLKSDSELKVIRYTI